jgi:hypothetical protein
MPTLNTVGVWPIIASLLGLLAFIGSAALILVARKRRSEETFDFQI